MNCAQNFLLFLAIVNLLSISVLANEPMLFSKNMKKPQFDSKEKKKTPRKNPLADKSFIELALGKDKALRSNDLATAVKYLDAMRLVSTDHEQIQKTLLEMADLYFKLEDWIKAEKAYNEFVLLYPGSTRCDYAHYKAVECGIKLTLTIDRDQTKTQETLELAQQFINTYTQSEYLEAVTKLKVECNQKLFESDINIFNFYVNNKNFKAAQIRLDTLCKEHVPQLPTVEPQVLELSIKLAQAQNNTQGVLVTQLELAQKFPEHDITKKWVADVTQLKTQLASLEQKNVTMPDGLPETKSVVVAQEQNKEKKLAA